jgi:hypothetical protein
LILLGRSAEWQCVIRSCEMSKNHSCVVGLESLQWPDKLIIPSKRFRLFVAADVRSIDARTLADFGEMALKNGMVYFCAWGPDCERFHDVLDDVQLADDLGQRLFAGPSPDDTIMTTWHDNETLEDAVEFFKHWARPDEGFRADSNYWVAICLQIRYGKQLFANSFSAGILQLKSRVAELLASTGRLPVRSRRHCRHSRALADALACSLRSALSLRGSNRLRCNQSQRLAHFDLQLGHDVLIIF